MLTDLFSHKIHASDFSWGDKLVELAFLFADFDGSLFDRSALEKRLIEISPRPSDAARDPSKFRDEISAYPAYLGLYRLEQSPRGWIIRLSDTSKRFLVQEEPNVSAFLRLQLSLFQYPNGMGVAYASSSSAFRLQANAASRTLDMIKRGFHLSPFRLISKGIQADAALRKVSIDNGRISFSEAYALANDLSINRDVNPPLMRVVSSLELVRSGKLNPPPSFESRFHILNHTDFIAAEDGVLRFGSSEAQIDPDILKVQVDALNSISVRFDGFDHISSEATLLKAMKNNAWGSYFDGVRIIPPKLVSQLCCELASDHASSHLPGKAAPAHVSSQPLAYDFKEYFTHESQSKASGVSNVPADPEITKVKRQRRNLRHKTILAKLEDLLRKKKAKPLQSPHIDLYGVLPSGQAFLFEVKSGGESSFEQARKGLSQLYEYRYRYKNVIDARSLLCLVVDVEPTDPPWLTDYLCKDRGLCVCWFDADGDLSCAEQCHAQLTILMK